jgi:glyoxylase-like metal-dependent hydrolase (beta-lactamase superfamily II)
MTSPYRITSPQFAFTTATAALFAALTGCANTPAAPDAATLIKQAEMALGGAGLKTLAISGKGSGGTVGQAYQPGVAWPGLNYSLMSRTMNFETGALREEFARSRSEPTGGGATPLMGSGEQKAVGFVRDGFAWSPAGTGFAAAPVAVDARNHDLWTGTPQGAIKAAQKYGAVAGTRVVGGQTFSTLSYTAPGQYAATLVLDAAGLVTRIESTVPNPVRGDTALVTEFSNYAPAGNLRFPMRIRQTQDGYAALDLTVTDVQPGAVADFAVPDNVRNFKENVTSEKVADGVWFLAGGSHNSVAIEMADQIVLVEAPLYEGRAKAVMATANALVPGKQVKTVINSHHHFDHAGGLRTAVAEGAELITSAAAKPYFEAAFANPNRIAPDALGKSGRKPKITGISGSTVLRDASRPVEVHEIQGSVHAQGFLMVWLPKEKLLIEADAYTPGAPNATPPTVPNANQVNLADNIERLGIKPERILPLHSRVAAVAELYQQIGRKQP